MASGFLLLVRREDGVQLFTLDTAWMWSFPNYGGSESHVQLPIQEQDSVLEALLVAVPSRLDPHCANLAIQTFGTRVGSTFPDGVRMPHSRFPICVATRVSAGIAAARAAAIQRFHLAPVWEV
jgi:hypothetical protein